MTTPDATVIIDRTLGATEITGLCTPQTPVTLQNCNLHDLDLGDLHMADWTFDRCNIARTSFSGTLLERAVFQNCRGAGATFYNAILTDARLDGGDFSNTKFNGARLNGATLSQCKMTGADFSDARADGMTLHNVLFVLALLPKFSFRDATLTGIDFTDADLRSCDFRDTIFEDCSLRNAHMSDCRFEKADLRGADLGGVKLTDAKRFKGAIISKRQAADLLGQLGLQVL